MLATLQLKQSNRLDLIPVGQVN